MKNIQDWKPTKYVFRKGEIVPTKDKKELNVASRLMAGEVGRFYSEQIPKYAKGKLIDLGCGKVPLYGFYKDFAEDIFCVDWVNTAHKNPYLDLEWDLNKNLDFSENQYYDTIILSDVLEHIFNPTNLINEMYRILKEDGVVIMNTPFYYWIHESPFDYYRYTHFALKKMLEESGFEIIEMKSLGGIVEVTADITAKCFKYLPMGRFFANFVQKFAVFIGKRKTGKKLRRRTEFLFPLGFGVVAKKC
jgi:SAM-dependent methyltransferase